jgi:hypothetical protein
MPSKYSEPWTRNEVWNAVFLQEEEEEETRHLLPKP